MNFGEPVLYLNKKYGNLYALKIEAKDIILYALRCIISLNVVFSEFLSILKMYLNVRVSITSPVCKFSFPQMFIHVNFGQELIQQSLSNLIKSTQGKHVTWWKSHVVEKITLQMC